jgi:hypothetical protein
MSYIIIPLPVLRTFKFPYNWSEITHCKKIGCHNYEWKWIRLSSKSATSKRVFARLEFVFYF